MAIIFYDSKLVQSRVNSSVFDRLSDRLVDKKCSYKDSTYQCRLACHYTFDLGPLVLATSDTVDQLATDVVALAFGIDPFDVRVIVASFASVTH